MKKRTTKAAARKRGRRAWIEIRMSVPLDLATSHPEAAAAVQLGRAGDAVRRGEPLLARDAKLAALVLGRLDKALCEAAAEKSPTVLLAEFADRIQAERCSIKIAIATAIKESKERESVANLSRVERALHRLRATRKRPRHETD